MTKLKTFVKTLLIKLGEYISPTHIHSLNSIINYLEVGRWLKAKGFGQAPRYHSRKKLYAAIAERIRDERVLYLEFGVYRGETLRQWSMLLRTPNSLFHGFDSFEGLPEGWNVSTPKGTFDLKGEMPTFDDPRVTLHKGWFRQTLPSFVIPEHERLVLNLDADLYTSTKFVLDSMRESIPPGTIIIFDEFSDRFHELKAFSEFIETTTMKFELVGATTNIGQAAFERIS